MAGIGWALLYLKENGLIEDDISEEIAEIDNQIGCFRLGRDNDLSLMTGSAGILAYALARISYACHYQIQATWIETDKEIMLAAAQRIVDESKELNALIYAHRFLLYVQEGYDYGDIPSGLEDWMKFYSEIPEEIQTWHIGLTGQTLSASAHYMINKLKQTNHEE